MLSFLKDNNILKGSLPPNEATKRGVKFHLFRRKAKRLSHGNVLVTLLTRLDVALVDLCKFVPSQIPWDIRACRHALSRALRLFGVVLPKIFPNYPRFSGQSRRAPHGVPTDPYFREEVSFIGDEEKWEDSSFSDDDPFSDHRASVAVFSDDEFDAP